MSEFDQPISAELAAELAAIDRLVDGRPDGTESPELTALTELLTVARPEPRPEFAAALDVKAEARFGLREPAKRRKPDWGRRWTWFRNGAVVAAIGASFAAIVVTANSPNQPEALSSVATTISGPTPSGSATQDSRESSSAGATSGAAATSTGSAKQPAGWGALNGVTTPSSTAANVNGALTLKVAPSRLDQTLTGIARTVQTHGGRVVKRQRTNSPLAYHFQVDVAADRLSSLISALERLTGVKVLARRLPTRPAQGSRTVQLVILLRTAKRP